MPEESAQNSPKDILTGIFEFDDTVVELLKDPSKYNEIKQSDLVNFGVRLVNAPLGGTAITEDWGNVEALVESIENLYRVAQLDNKDYFTHFGPEGDTSITCGDATDVNTCAKVGLGAGTGPVKYHNFIHGLQCLYHFNKLLDNALSTNSIFVLSTDRSTGSTGSLNLRDYLRDYLMANNGKNLLYCRLAALGHDAGHKGEREDGTPVYTPEMQEATKKMFEELEFTHEPIMQAATIEDKKGPVIEEYHTALVLTCLKEQIKEPQDTEYQQIIKNIIYATCLKKTIIVDDLFKVTEINEDKIDGFPGILKTIIHLADLGNPLTQQHLVWAQGVAEERGKTKIEANNSGIHGIIFKYLTKNTHIKQEIKENIEGYIDGLPKNLPASSLSPPTAAVGGRKRNKTKKRNKISKRKSNKCKKMCNHNKYLNCCKICIKKKHTKKKCKKMCKHNKYLSCCKKCQKK